MPRKVVGIVTLGALAEIDLIPNQRTTQNIAKLRHPHLGGNLPAEPALAEFSAISFVGPDGVNRCIEGPTLWQA